jgi:hypothetical protein
VASLRITSTQAVSVRYQQRAIVQHLQRSTYTGAVRQEGTATQELPAVTAIGAEEQAPAALLVARNHRRRIARSKRQLHELLDGTGVRDTWPQKNTIHEASCAHTENFEAELHGHHFVDNSCRITMLAREVSDENANTRGAEPSHDLQRVRWPK